MLINVKGIRMAFAVSRQTMRQWRGNYRIIIIFVLAVMLVVDFIQPLYLLGSRYGYAVTPWILPFIDSQPYMKAIINLGIVFLFSDAPFIRQNQIFVLTRCGRVTYALGQLLAILKLTMCYFLVLAFVPVLIYANRTGWSIEWGDVLFTAANTDIVMATGGIGKIIISSNIIRNLSPIQAVSLSYIFHVLTGVILGYTIYLGNLGIVRSKWSGVFAALILIITDPLLNLFHYRWSPVSWGDLNLLDYVHNGARLSVGEAFSRLVLLVILIAVCCVGLAKKREIRVLDE